MKYSIHLIVSSLACGLALASTNDTVPPWHPPTPDAFRGPCPMMNTLANHGYIPRDGRGITKQVVIDAMGGALNFDPELATIMFDQAVIANPEPNATFFTLDHLNQHNVLEHDASLSRLDAYFGNNHVFDQAVFDEARSYWTGPVIDANMIASSKLGRQVSSKAFNPTYKFTATIEEFSLGEVAAPFIAFGDLESVTVPRDLVEYFFMNERLPTELGWSRKNETVTLNTILNAVVSIRNASTLFTDSTPENNHKRRVNSLVDLHMPIHLPN